MNYGGAGEAASSIGLVGEGLQAEIEGLRREVENRSANWNAEQKEAFRYQLSRWDAAMANLSSTELSTARTVVNSAVAYRATDAANARRFAV
jgi:uncharacterized protein YukE